MIHFIKKSFFSRSKLIIILCGTIIILASLFIIKSINFNNLLSNTKQQIIAEHNALNTELLNNVDAIINSFLEAPKILSAAFTHQNQRSLTECLQELFEKNDSIIQVSIDSTNPTVPALTWKVINQTITKQDIHPPATVLHSTGWSAPFKIDEKTIIYYSTAIPNSESLIHIGINCNHLQLKINEYKNSHLINFILKDTLGNIITEEHFYKKINHYFLSVRNITKHQAQLPSTRWQIETSYEPNDIPIGAIRSFLMAIITLGAFLACLFFILIALLEHINLSLTTLCIAGILAFANYIIWTTIYYLPLDPVDEIVRINDPVNCKKFIDKQKKHATQLNCSLPPINEVGMLVQSLDVNQEKNAQVETLVWQHIDKTKKITGLSLMHNEGETGTEISHNNPDGTTRMWLFNTKVTAPNDDTFYPLHTCYITLEVAPNDYSEPLLLIPDKAMRSLPGHPWISKTLNNIGYILEDSFITTEELAEPALNNLTHPMGNKLLFHFIYREDLTGALINYIIPLLIVLFAIFALLWFGHYTIDRFAGYTGTCFVSVLLHSTLRTTRHINTISYLDYFFLYAYLSTLICMIAALLIIRKPDKYAKLDIWLQHLYWPIQLILWLITTALVFS